MVQKIHESVSVISIYEPGKNGAKPYKMFWRGRPHKITEVGYYHRRKVGALIEHVYDVTDGAKLPAPLLRKLAEASAVVGGEMQHRAIYSATSCQMRKIAVDKTASMVFNTACSQVLAEEYSAYKVAAVQAVVERFKSNIDTDSVYAVTASQNLFQE